MSIILCNKLTETYILYDLLELATECQERHIKNSDRQVGPWHGSGSLWPVIAEAQFQFHPHLCGIGGRQSGTGTGLPLSGQVLFCLYHSTNFPYSIRLGLMLDNLSILQCD